VYQKDAQRTVEEIMLSTDPKDHPCLNELSPNATEKEKDGKLLADMLEQVSALTLKLGMRVAGPYTIVFGGSDHEDHNHVVDIFLWDAESGPPPKPYDREYYKDHTTSYGN